MLGLAFGSTPHFLSFHPGVWASAALHSPAESVVQRRRKQQWEPGVGESLPKLSPKTAGKDGGNQGDSRVMAREGARQTKTSWVSSPSHQPASHQTLSSPGRVTAGISALFTFFPSVSPQ